MRCASQRGNGCGERSWGPIASLLGANGWGTNGHQGWWLTGGQPAKLPVKLPCSISRRLLCSMASARHILPVLPQHTKRLTSQFLMSYAVQHSQSDVVALDGAGHALLAADESDWDQHPHVRLRLVCDVCK